MTPIRSTVGDVPVRSQRIRNLDDAVDFVRSLIRAEPRTYAARDRLGLAPTRNLLERLGNPEADLPCIHIAGSKGKGSTALVAEAILESAGVRTATFTSPHLRQWTERFRVAGTDVSGPTLAAALEAIRPHVVALHAQGAHTAPSFFDVLTSAALYIFREAEVACAILETGLGGRLDATNVVQPIVACITSVELEHTDKLGANLASIAREKAGIIKPGAGLVVGSLPEVALHEVERRAVTLGVAPARFGREFGTEPRDDGRWAFHDGELAFESSLRHRGRAYAHNAALALACVQRSELGSGKPIAEIAPRVLRDLVVPGRFQVLARSPWLVVDGAHTAQSGRALAHTLANLPSSELHLVVSVTRGKNPLEVLHPLLARAAHVLTTTADAERSLPASALARVLKAAYPRLTIAAVDDPTEAVQRARRRLPVTGALCMTGSMYMAGAALGALAADDGDSGARAG